jgi:hypothetical protein
MISIIPDNAILAISLQSEANMAGGAAKATPSNDCHSVLFLRKYQESMQRHEAFAFSEWRLFQGNARLIIITNEIIQWYHHMTCPFILHK